MISVELLVSVLFWLCVSGVLYAYVGYPGVVWSCAAAFGRRRVPPRLQGSQRLPFVSVLIVAHNEEECIGARVDNALAVDYPRERLEIVIASDGSTDRTTAIARSRQDPRVRVVEFRTRRGKASVLNQVIPTLASDIVVLSDANTQMEPTAVRRMVRWFSDEQVGVVVGRLVLTDPITGKNVDSLYWKYETFLKRCDARLNALLGASGAIYGLRRNRFTAIPADTLVDDLVLPMLMRLKNDSQIVYDESVVAHEETPADLFAEFRRRTRIGAGGFHSLATLWPLLSPARGWIAFTFLSHKVLRWVCPLLLVGAASMNLVLTDPIYKLGLSVQVAFYAVAAAGALAPGGNLAIRLMRLATLFTSMQVALMIGLAQWIAGMHGGTWERTARSPAPASVPRPRDSGGVTDRPPILVVHLVIGLEIGGLETVVANLARQMGERFRLRVICFEGLGPIASRFARAGVTVECIGRPDTSIARSVIRLRRRLKALRPDVIHTHNEKAHIRGALATLGFSPRPALVHTRHGESQATGLAALANRFAIWRSDFIVSVSEKASAISRAEGAPPSRTRVIRNGIDVNHQDLHAGARTAQTRIVAIGRLAPVKDFATMLHAARIVADALPWFRLDVVGDGPSRPELERLCRELRLHAHVSFQGTRDDVRRVLSEATLLVQSSLSEGISLTLLEAMAAGVPIVATRVGGNPEVVEHGVTGLLVPPADPQSLAAAILTVLNDPRLAIRLSEHSRLRAQRHFNLRQMTASYEALYHEAVANPDIQAA
jgi:glycosyltransferase involved in cell wall biosynthesis